MYFFSMYVQCILKKYIDDLDLSCMVWIFISNILIGLFIIILRCISFVRLFRELNLGYMYVTVSFKM